ncbi:MAG TPA: serine hydrolase domain-containing protein, partial [Verrucomicrobiales bacterium]|nr:serine hydrolase domain-containing protein [Verrucomicrobiales bacterium]
ITLEDKFHLGSCTKAFTATAAAVLVEEGTITWQTTMGESLRALRPGAGWESVRLEHLLTNTGGFPGSPPPEVWEEAWAAKGSARRQRESFLKEMLRDEPRFTPGDGFEYSNAGYAAAGVMLESAAGESWEDLIRTKIFEPLGMKSGGFGAPGSRARTPDQPWGHDSEGNPVAPGPGADNPLAIAPAGAIHCSLPDWARFALLHMERAGGRVLRREESFHKLHTPVRERYAMGWSVAERSWADGPALTHMGSNTMFTAVLWIAPERGFAAMVAANISQEAAAAGCEEVVGELVTRYLK